jgi:hypothetical protein
MYPRSDSIITLYLMIFAAQELFDLWNLQIHTELHQLVGRYRERRKKKKKSWTSVYDIARILRKKSASWWSRRSFERFGRMAPLFASATHHVSNLASQEGTPLWRPRAAVAL